eukprot:CAMPEP_0175927144 /NCGR_PEP_ID=MMETSP0108-20121206/16564_1 /TAXON_ID=195067 ORGANISM="Goniomonas pacifica, Strain CCMP1869" /NCGR_SAMPLE_ID=MMETSP0108 /ASSEMBLY_ACC=CAM_ASM_000204 /LENGTH=66 /DNA_ID=CAMNT_0017250425 /DNA_START=359 /DNA_END=555 /DNA_ORIENTATION=-
MSNTAAWLIDMSELELERVLACGGMARVWLGKWRGLHVAIKQSTLFIDDDYLWGRHFMQVSYLSSP